MEGHEGGQGAGGWLRRLLGSHLAGIALETGAVLALVAAGALLAVLMAGGRL